MNVNNVIVHSVALGALLLAACTGAGTGGGFGGDGFEAEPEVLEEGDAAWLDISGASLNGRLGSMNAASGPPDDAKARYEGGLWFYLEHQQGDEFGRAVIDVPYDWTSPGGVLVSTLALGDDPERAALWGIAADASDEIVDAGSARPHTCSGAQGGLCENRREADDFIVRLAPCTSCSGDARNIDFVFWTGDDEITGQLTAAP